MRKVSLIGNSLAYLLCQEAKRTTDYRLGMTPEDVHAVSEKSGNTEHDSQAVGGAWVFTCVGKTQSAFSGGTHD